MKNVSWPSWVGLSLLVCACSNTSVTEAVKGEPEGGAAGGNSTGATTNGVSGEDRAGQGNVTGGSGGRESAVGGRTNLGGQTNRGGTSPTGGRANDAGGGGDDNATGGRTDADGGVSGTSGETSGQGGGTIAGGHEEIAGTSSGRGGTSSTRGGTSSAQGGTPDEQGGTPDEQGGTPDEQGGTPDGQGGTPDEQGGTPAEQGGTPAEQGGAPAEQGGSGGTGGSGRDVGGGPTAEGGTPGSGGGAGAPNTSFTVVLSGSISTFTSLSQSTQLGVECVYAADGRREDCFGNATFASSNQGVALVSSTGRVSPVSNGSAYITATVSPFVSDPFPVTVDIAEHCTSLRINGPATVAAAESIQLLAFCDFADGQSGIDVTNRVGWDSSVPSSATVSSTGQVTGVERNTATVISATFANENETTTFSTFDVAVTEGQLLSIEISPGTPDDLPSGYIVNFNAACQYADMLVPCTGSVNWSSSNPSVGELGDAYIIGRAVGTTVVKASLDGVDSNEATLNVTAPIFDRVEIDTVGATIVVGESRWLYAWCYMSDGSYWDCSEDAGVTWGSTDPSILEVTGNGAGIGIAPGSAGVTVDYNGYQAYPATVTVLAP